MALQPLKLFLAGEILTASDLNALNNHILSNALQLISPVTGNLDMDGNSLLLDDDGDTLIKATTDDRIDLVASNVPLWMFDGTVATPLNGFTFRATATGTAPSIEVMGDTNQNLDLIPAGTGELEIKGVVWTYDSNLHHAVAHFS